MTKKRSSYLSGKPAPHPVKQPSQGEQSAIRVEEAAEEITKGLLNEGVLSPDVENDAKIIVEKRILEIRQKASILQGWFVSPFAPKSEQIEYEKLCPGVTDRQMSVFEKRMDNLNTCDMIGVISYLIGMVLAFCVVMAGIYAGFILLREEKGIGGFVAMLSPLGVIAGLFFLKNVRGKKDCP